MLPTKDIVKAMWSKRFSRELEQRNLIRRLEELAPIIDRLPKELSHSYDLVFTAYPGDDSAVRRVCGQVRDVLGAKKSEKSLDSRSGTITLTTEGHGITVKIYGGAVPSNCKLTASSQSYVTWEMVCKEAN